MSRASAKLVEFDPKSHQSTTVESSSSTSTSIGDYSYTEWAFYEKGSFMISWDLVAKAAYSNSQRTNFIYIAKKTKNNGVSVVKGSAWEMSRLLSFLSHALDQIYQHPSDGKSFETLIPMLDADENARVTMTKDNKMTFFEQSQVRSQNLHCRLVFSEILGEYVAYIRTPVSDEIQQRLKWCGPCFQLSQEEMSRLESFLKHALVTKVVN